MSNFSFFKNMAYVVAPQLYNSAEVIFTEDVKVRHDALARALMAWLATGGVIFVLLNQYRPDYFAPYHLKLLDCDALHVGNYPGLALWGAALVLAPLLADWAVRALGYNATSSKAPAPNKEFWSSSAH